MIRFPPVLKKILSVLIVVVILGFMAWTIVRSWPTVVAELRHVNALLLAAAFAGLFLSLLNMPFVMQVLLRKFGVRSDFATCYKIFFLSLMGKYVPGKVWNLLGQYYLGREYGIPRKDITAVTLLQLILNNLSGLYVAALTSLVFFNLKVLLVCLPFVLLSPLALVLVSPARLSSFFSWAYRNFKKKESRIEFDFKFRDLVPAFILYFLNWIIVGISIFLLISAFHPMPLTSLVHIVSIVSISWLVAYVTLLTPGGLGFREGVMSALLLTFMTAPIAMSLTLLIRVAETAVDAVAVLIAIPLKAKPPEGNDFSPRPAPAEKGDVRRGESGRTHVKPGRIRRTDSPKEKKVE